MKISVDWHKQPEVQWEKRMCPFCQKPTGTNTGCEKLMNPSPLDMEEEEGKSFAKTVEINGDIQAIFSSQCYYKGYNNYYVHFNFPLSELLVNTLSGIEGIERFHIITSYRAEVTIGRQFEDSVIKKKMKKIYTDFIRKNMEISDELESDIIND